MSGFNASNFRRVHIGMLLDLILLFLIPVLLAGLIVILINQVSSTVVDIEAVTVADLIAKPTAAVQGIYVLIAMQYCLSALCSLLVVSGLGELESVSADLRRAKLWFMLLIMADGITMLGHLSDVMLTEGVLGSLTTALFFVAVLMMLVFHALALRFLMRGYAGVLEGTGAPEMSRRIRALASRITVAAVVLVAMICAIFFMWLLNLTERIRVVLILPAIASFAFHLVCRIQAVHCARTVARRITALSE
ncbi:MAG: hypothetical protein IIU49_01410 [Spirochaetales bacterium]|nr:hypothetical protein [Spirochaetales bacterium]